MTATVPWEGTGKTIRAEAFDDFLEKADLSWRVEKCEAFLEGTSILAGDHALVRIDSPEKPLTYVSESWEVIQNSQGLRFFWDLASASGLKVTTAGSLSGGRIVWAIAEGNKTKLELDPYKFSAGLLFTLPHAYGQAMSIAPIHIRQGKRVATWVDWKSWIVFNHRNKLEPGTIDARALIAKSLDKRAALFHHLSSVKKTDQSYFQKVFGGPTKLSKPGEVALAEFEKESPNGLGMFWASAYAIDCLLGQGPSTRLESAWYGVNSKKKELALRLL